MNDNYTNNNLRNEPEMVFSNNNLNIGDVVELYNAIGMVVEISGEFCSVKYAMGVPVRVQKCEVLRIMPGVAVVGLFEKAALKAILKEQEEVM